MSHGHSRNTKVKLHNKPWGGLRVFYEKNWLRHIMKVDHGVI